jgi:O-antigen biosynthesis protein
VYKGATVKDTQSERVLFQGFNRERLIAANYIEMSTFVHRRSIIDRFRGFDEELSTHEDWDLILRYTAHALPIQFRFLLHVCDG